MYNCNGSFICIFKIGYDRPLMYFGLYALSKVLGMVNSIKVLPVLCHMLYVLSIYFFFRYVSGGYAGIASLIASASYTVTAGLWGGLYSNWFSLSFGVFASIFLFLYHKKGLLKYGLLYVVFHFLTLGFHAYQGIVYTAILVFLFVISVILKDGKLRRIAIVLIIPGLAFLLLIFGPYYRPFYINYIHWTKLISKYVFNFEMFSERWWLWMFIAVYNYGAGAGADYMGWSFSLFGSVLTGVRDFSRRLLFAWIFVTGFLAAFAPMNLIYRSIFDLPVAIYEALGLIFFAKFLDKDEGSLFRLFLALYVLFRLNYLFRFVGGMLWQIRV